VNIWTQERGNKAEERNKEIHILFKFNQSDNANKNEMSRTYRMHERL
jgi:hypothetical protein